jgi:hypothetical protein
VALGAGVGLPNRLATLRPDCPRNVTSCPLIRARKAQPVVVAGVLLQEGRIELRRHGTGRSLRLVHFGPLRASSRPCPCRSACSLPRWADCADGAAPYPAGPPTADRQALGAAPGIFQLFALALIHVRIESVSTLTSKFGAFGSHLFGPHMNFQQTI